MKQETKQLLEKVYLYSTRSLFLAFGTFMLITIVNNQFYNFIMSDQKHAQGMAILVYALLASILFSFGISHFINILIQPNKKIQESRS